MNDKVIKEVLEFSIKVRTYTGEERLIYFSDIKCPISSSLAIYNENDLIKIEFEMECLGYTKGTVEVKIND